MDEILAQRLGGLAPRARALLEPWLRGDDEARLFRACPAEWASERQLELDDALDVLLRGAHAGLLRLSWELVCPRCFRLFDFVETLTEIKDHGFCRLCETETHVALDDWIHVSFTVRPEVRRLRFHDPAALTAIERNVHCETGRGVVLADGTRLYRHTEQNCALYEEVPAGEARTVRVPAGEAAALMLVPRQFVPVGGGGSDLEMRFEEAGIRLSAPRVARGDVALSVVNASNRAQLCAVTWAGSAQLAGPPRMAGCTATQVIHHPTYAALFPSQLVCAGGIAIREVTLMFSDLYGSTAMYRALGDLAAYQRVRECFAEAARAIAGHRGVWIKDMGDAVMASFPTPDDGVAAAQQMIADCRSATGLELKIGLHCGSCIAVSFRDRLDWFGSTVNLAARVQSLAGPGEICVSSAVFEHSAAARALPHGPAFEAQVRGIAEPVVVYRIDVGGEKEVAWPGSRTGASRS
jgi:class 3 adenylate cyclase